MLYEIYPHPYAPLLATFVWSVLICGVAQLIVFRVPLFESLLKAPIVPPFMALPAILFAFLMAFMASAAWQNISLARTSLVNEQSALARLAAVPVGPVAAREKMHDELKRYVTAVLDDEWTGRHNEAVSPAAESSLSTLTTGIWTLGGKCGGQSLVDCTSDAAIATYVKALDDLRVARGDRLSLGFQGTLRLKWVLVIALAFATALSIAAIHRSSARTSAISLAIYSLSIWMTFAMVSLHIQPYRGPDALSPGLLQDFRGKL